MREQIRDCQIWQVQICRRLHVLVLNDDDDGGHVAQDAHHEQDGVQDGDGDDGVEVKGLGAKMVLDEPEDIWKNKG